MIPTNLSMAFRIPYPLFSHILRSSKFSYLIKCAPFDKRTTLLNTIKCPNNLAGEADAPPYFTLTPIHIYDYAASGMK
jgi:hypothetical protein